MYIEKLKDRFSHIQKRNIIIIAVVLLLIMAGSVFAKYIFNTGGRNLLSAKEFYFTSNLLTEDKAKYVLNSTSTEISFTLGNNADKLRYSQDDIQYSIAVESKNGGSTPTLVYADDEKVLKGGAVDTTSVTMKGLEMGKTYVVTATGQAGYKQTLKAEFEVSDKDENVYKYLDVSNDKYLLLTVWAENVTGNLKIEVNKTGLVPDNTDPALRNMYNYKDGVYEVMAGNDAIDDTKNYLKKYSSYTYRFFVSENKIYSVDDFNVFIENNGTKYLAENSIPK
ncbi:MAG: hypothetical protein IJA54_04720 [Tyzzerella sp.]|nr:hypothetical protein [Tyzzerella sp.]